MSNFIVKMLKILINQTKFIIIMFTTVKVELKFEYTIMLTVMFKAIIMFTMMVSWLLEIMAKKFMLSGNFLHLTRVIKFMVALV